MDSEILLKGPTRNKFKKNHNATRAGKAFIIDSTVKQNVDESTVQLEIFKGFIKFRGTD